MFFKNANYYKGYDIDNKSRLERIRMEYSNHYWYNLESNQRRVVDIDSNVTHTNQNMVKNREYKKEK